MSDGVRDAFKSGYREVLDNVFGSAGNATGSSHGIYQSTVSDVYGNDNCSKSEPASSGSLNIPDNRLGTVLEATPGLKYDKGKTDLSLLPSKSLTDVANVLEYGATKYQRNNWAKGIAYSRVYSAAMRHMMEWKDGQRHDPETMRSHLSHAICNLLFLLEYELSGKDAEFDDLHNRD